MKLEKLKWHILCLTTLMTINGCSKKSTPTPPDDTSKLTISTLSLNEGPYNTPITITGTGFSFDASKEAVYFNGKSAQIYTSSSTQIVVMVPLSAGTGKVSIVVDGRNAIGPDFTYDISKVVITLAGSVYAGSTNGVGTAAKFNNPYGIAVDVNNNIYVADQGNNIIRKITPDGTVSTIAGSGAQGNSDGTGINATFNGPSGLAVGKDGNIYVADTFNSVIRKITPLGVVTTLAGNGLPHSNDGAGTAASFYDMYGLTIDNSNNIYVADTQNSLIRKITPGGVVSTFAGSGFVASGDGIGTHADFAQPTGITLDNAGNLYVSDQFNSHIRKVTSGAQVSLYAGSSQGFRNGSGLSSQFAIPQGMASDQNGNIYIADTGNNLIRIIDSNGQVSTYAGVLNPTTPDNGIVTKAGFRFPTGVAVDKNGDVYVADAASNQIRKITTQ